MIADVAGDRPIRIDRLRRTVSDLQRSIDFYCGALGFERCGGDTSSTANATRLRLGAQHIDLVLGSAAVSFPSRVNAPDPRFQHAAIVTRDIEVSWQRLQTCSAVAITVGGPQRLPAHTGGVAAFKFRDPDGHPLELIEFPAGIGDSCWRAAGIGGPTLGIDHFALVVEQVDRSVAFFAERLGLRVVGRDVNQGVEQDRLDGLEGVEVDVVSLEAKKGLRTPHLELLRYRRPAFSTPAEGSRTECQQASDEIIFLGEQTLRARPGGLRMNDPDRHRFTLEA